MFEVDDKVRMTANALRKYGKEYRFTTFIVMEKQKDNIFTVKTTSNVPLAFGIDEKDLMYA